MTRRRATGEGIGGRPRKHSPRAKRVAVPLPPKLLKALQKMARDVGLTVPEVCIEAIAAFVTPAPIMITRTAEQQRADYARLQKTLDDQT